MTTVDIVTVENKKLFAVEVAIILLLFAGERYGWVPISKTPFLFAVAWISLRLRGFRWRDVGLTRPESWAAATGIGVTAGAALGLLGLFVTRPFFMSLTGQQPDLSDVAAIRGNAVAFATVLTIAWLLYAIGEELVFRGYMMTRFARMMSGQGAAWIISLIVVSLLFGLGRGDRGLSGMLENVVNGLLLGGLYLATGRNLVAPILAHGVANTVELTLMFLGRYPGM